MDARHEFLQDGYGKDAEGGSPQSTDLAESSLKGALRETQRKKKRLYTILVIVGIIPVLCLCGVVLYQVIKSAQVQNDAKSARKDAVNYLDVSTAVTLLLAERGASARVFTIGGAFFKEQERQWRENADGHINNFDFSRLQKLPEDFNTKEKFKEYLKNFRQEVDDKKHDAAAIFRFFTDLVEKLVKATQSSIRLPSASNLWREMGAAVQLLSASEPMISLLTLARTFFFRCSYSKEEIVQYHFLTGSQESLINYVVSLDKENVFDYENRYMKSQLRVALESVRRTIESHNFTEVCRNLPEAERMDWNFPWFRAMAHYYILILGMRTELVDHVKETLDKVVYDEENIMVMYIIVFLIVAFCCVVLTVVLTSRLAVIVNDLVTTATRSKAATYQLGIERKKADKLLYRMMPSSVVEELKSGREVAPKQFRTVTVSYVDIANFYSLISGMEPLDVTKMMKVLYKMFDSLIDEHNVHKAEQSNDVTCVVSGVPQYIDSHAAEIANFTIHLMQSVENFKVENLPDVQIKVRIGIHTGPCAAGITGHKSLRYSIFGESVKMASRMSRNNQVQKIQMSRQTKDALFVYGDTYNIQERGLVDIYGIGKVKTYFLNGHRPGAKIPGKTGLPRGILKMK